MYFIDFNMFLTLFFSVFISSVLIQISYWIFFLIYFYRKSYHKSSNDYENQPTSIIICVKNEYENILKNVDSWVSQLSQNDELILMNDFSTDQSQVAIENIMKQNLNVFGFKVSKDLPGKKQAITEGIAIAKNSYILITDADCSPNSGWKKSMLSKLESDTSFVLGYAPFHKKIGFLNIFQRFECLLTAVQYFSYTSSGNPYMGVGRNMMFQKNIFSPEIYNPLKIASGDDDLLVSAKSNKKNVKLSLDPESFVYSDSKNSLTSYIKQKSRHIKSASEYKKNIKFFLFLFAASQIMSNVLFLFFVFTCWWKMTILLFLLKQSIITLGLYKSALQLKEIDLVRYSPILDLCLTFYYLLLGFVFPLMNKKTWN